jgi:hypothetical protein
MRGRPAKQCTRIGVLGEKGCSPRRAAKRALLYGERVGGVQLCVDEFGVIYGVWPCSRLAAKVMARNREYVVGSFYVDRNPRTKTLPQSEINAIAQQITYTLATLRGTAA